MFSVQLKPSSSSAAGCPVLLLMFSPQLSSSKWILVKFRDLWTPCLCLTNHLLVIFLLTWSLGRISWAPKRLLPRKLRFFGPQTGVSPSK